MKGKKLNSAQIFTFCTALHDLQQAGISLGDSFQLLAADEENSHLRETFQKMAQWADEGASLADSVRQSGAFPGYVCGILSVGQRTGKTQEALQALSRCYEARERLDRQLRSAFLYPAALLLVLLTVAVVLLVWVLPVFNDVYAQQGSSLTGFAGWLLALGKVLGSAMPLICAVLAVLAVLLLIPRVRHWLGKGWRLLLGDRGAHGQLLSARFLQAVSMAVSSGMTPREAMLLARELAEGEAKAFHNRCKCAMEEVEKDVPLHLALEKGRFLRSPDRRLLDAAYRSGKGESALEKISQRSMEEAEAAMERQTAVAEPILITVACGLIGAVLLTVLLPLMQIMSAIG
jgi:type IV pilus assembly protein PilC